jgi:hypothetical protein
VLTWQPGRYSKARQPHVACTVNKQICRFDVLMNEPALVSFSHRSRQPDREVKEARQFKWLSKKFNQGIATGIL